MVHNEKKNILLTVFEGTSSELLLNGFRDFPVLVLPNDKVKDSELLLGMLSETHFDYVLSFGQRPNIKDKVHIETNARDGDLRLDTVFNCERLRMLFEQNGIPAKLSHNAGTSFCNKLYWNGLKYIEEHELETKMVFIHVPFGRNISDIELFKNRIFETIRIFMQN
ncbi:MAG: hypothetical protein IJX95_00075 [Lachnospiraceae bacterium]|nr:hypothetical protein [Lachnospiraceae bacterium]